MAIDGTPPKTETPTGMEALGSLLSRRAEEMISVLRAQANALIEDRASLFLGATGRSSARKLGIKRRLRVKAHRKTDHEKEEPDRNSDEIDAAERMRRELREQQLASLARETTEVLPWQRVLRQKPRIVLLGEPGGGKSYSTRLEMANRLDRAASALEHAFELPDEFPLLAWGTAEMLADQQCAATSKKQRNDYLRASLRNEHIPVEIGSNRNSLIVIDALDEMSSSKNNAFTKNLKNLCQDFAGTVVVTCRVGQWQGRADWIAADSFEVATFEPLHNRDQRQLFRKIASTLGRSEDVDVAGFQSLLRRRTVLSIDFGTPLLLTFASLLHLEGDLSTDESMRPCDLYGQILTRLMRGTWKENPPDWCVDEDEVERLRECLGLAAWKLFQLEESPERSGVRNLFSLAELRECGINKKILRKVQEVGILVAAGKNQTGRSCFAFAHRSLLEFLAAEGLSAKANREDLEKKVLTRSERLEDSIFWLLHEEWEPVLGFLHGLLPAGLRDRLEKVENRDDFFDSVWKLRRRLGFSIKIDEVDFDGRVREEIKQALLKLHMNKIWEVSEISEIALTEVGGIGVEDLFINLCTCKDEDLRNSAILTLRKFRSEDVLNFLIGLLKNPDPAVLGNAVEALGHIGGDRSESAIVGIYLDSEGEFGAEELGCLYSEKAESALKSILCDGSGWARASAAAALLRSGVNIEEYEPLKLYLERALSSRDYETLYFEALDTLEGLEDDGVTKLLTNLCTHEDEDVRVKVARIFEKYSGENALSVLTPMLSDTSSYVREQAMDSILSIDREFGLCVFHEMLSSHQISDIHAADIIGLMRYDKGVDILIEMCSSSDKHVAEVSAISLGLIGTNKSVNALIDLCKVAGLQKAAAKALGIANNSLAVDVLKGLCYDQDFHVSQQAARSLGAIISKASEDALKDILHDPRVSESVRNSAGRALIFTGNAAAVELFINSIKFSIASRKSAAKAAFEALPIDSSEDVQFSLRDDDSFQDIEFGFECAFNFQSRMDQSAFIRSIGPDLFRLASNSVFVIFEELLETRPEDLLAFPWEEHRLIQKRCRRAFLPYEWTLKE